MSTKERDESGRWWRWGGNEDGSPQSQCRSSIQKMYVSVSKTREGLRKNRL